MNSAMMDLPAQKHVGILCVKKHYCKSNVSSVQLFFKNTEILFCNSNVYKR